MESQHPQTSLNPCFTLDGNTFFIFPKGPRGDPPGNSAKRTICDWLRARLGEGLPTPGWSWMGLRKGPVRNVWQLAHPRGQLGGPGSNSGKATAHPAPRARHAYRKCSGAPPGAREVQVRPCEVGAQRPPAPRPPAHPRGAIVGSSRRHVALISLPARGPAAGRAARKVARCGLRPRRSGLRALPVPGGVGAGPALLRAPLVRTRRARLPLAQVTEAGRTHELQPAESPHAHPGPRAPRVPYDDRWLLAASPATPWGPTLVLHPRPGQHAQRRAL